MHRGNNLQVVCFAHVLTNPPRFVTCKGCMTPGFGFLLGGSGLVGDEAQNLDG